MSYIPYTISTSALCDQHCVVRCIVGSLISRLISNKNIKLSFFKSSEIIQKKEGWQTDRLRIINSLQP